MKRAFFVLIAIAVFSSLAAAQDKSLLYEVSGNGLARPSYLFGTFHLVCPTDLQLSAATSKALSDAQQLFLEIDFDDPSLQFKLASAMMFTDGKNMKALLNADDYAVIDAYLQKNLGAGLALIGNLKPIGLLSLLYRTLLNCEVASYDLTFASMATQNKKEVFGLETVEEQIAFFDKIPLEQQLKSIAEMVRKPDEARKEMVQLLAAYKAQDVPQLMKLIAESELEEMQGFQEELLDKRNTAWIPIIEKAARSGSTFFAFGAGHLGGPNGVVSLLRKKGYTVKPLP